MVALYVHWPFCKAKCPYCDFNSHVRAEVDHARWARALVRETKAALAPYHGRKGVELESVFFGGGTPSLMAPETVAAVLEAARALTPFAADVEITLEANPTSVEAAKFEAFRAAGVNRVSLGVQALDDGALRFLGREHDAAEAMAAVDLARAIFPRWSFDLIYARPEQSPDAWARELEGALFRAGDHLSLYQLTLEPGTAFFTRARLGERMTAEEEAAVDLWETTQAVTAAAGFCAYEVSNHARPGGESRHNLVYWRYGDYAGVGPGAHGRVDDGAGGKVATARVRLPERWLEAVESQGEALAERALVPVEDRRRELLLMGLRLTEGVAERRLVEETGRGFDALDPMRLKALQDEGWIVFADGALKVTKTGRPRLNALLGYLVD
ncbi:MAG: radical SAM family heme chaperone HemW [Marivibrio sp.]|uniref:radical SAM family heme chaperone HemW n=1 Tax=Marivibrio sp. TaxID=2039719 RepID=UPI0032ED8D98